MDSYPLQEQLMTAEELPRHPELEPCELVKGKIIRLRYNTVPHGRLLAEIGMLLGNYADKSGLAKAGMGRVGVLTRRDPDTVRAADLVLISRERYACCDPSRYLDVAPELVVEILSPEEDLWCYVMGKLADYLAAGVDRVWLVDPELRSIFAYRSLTEFERFEEGDILTDEEILPGLSLPVADIFRE